MAHFKGWSERTERGSKSKEYFSKWSEAVGTSGRVETFEGVTMAHVEDLETIGETNITMYSEREGGGVHCIRQSEGEHRRTMYVLVDTSKMPRNRRNQQISEHHTEILYMI